MLKYLLPGEERTYQEFKDYYYPKILSTKNYEPTPTPTWEVHLEWYLGTNLWIELREVVIDTLGNLCQYCGRKSDTGYFSMVPKGKKGVNLHEIWNAVEPHFIILSELTLACTSCHLHSGHHPCKTKKIILPQITVKVPEYTWIYTEDYSLSIGTYEGTLKELVNVTKLKPAEVDHSGKKLHSRNPQKYPKNQTQ